MRRGQRRHRLEHLRQPLLRRESAEGADHEMLRAETVPGPDLGRGYRVGRRQRIGDAHGHGLPPRLVLVGQAAGEGGAVHDREPRRPQQQTDVRPQPEQRAAEALGHQAAGVGRGGRMVRRELPQVVVAAGVPSAQQRLGAGLVHLGVVQHDQPRVAEQVAPHVAVTGGVAELVDHQVVRRRAGGATRSPARPGSRRRDRRLDRGRRRRPPSRPRARSRGRSLRRVRGDARRRRRHRAEPRDPRARTGPRACPAVAPSPAPPRNYSWVGRLTVPAVVDYHLPTLAKFFTSDRDQQSTARAVDDRNSHGRLGRHRHHGRDRPGIRGGVGHPLLLPGPAASYT